MKRRDLLRWLVAAPLLATGLKQQPETVVVAPEPVFFASTAVITETSIDFANYLGQSLLRRVRHGV